MKPSELISTPDKWTYGVFARDKKGSPFIASSHHGIGQRFLRADDQEAACWCLAGALDRVFGDYDSEAKRAAFDKIADRVKPDWDRTSSFSRSVVMAWNDHPDRNHREVITVLKELDL